MEDHQEEALVGSKHMIYKGKRTKRQRTMSHPFLSTMATTSSSCSSGGEVIGGGVFGDHMIHYSSSGFDHVTTSPSNSGELTQSSVEEEDMANCLILLAQGHAQKSTQPNNLTMITTITTKSSSVVHDVYQCKTCNRSFPSFQALGGHRASHKKPKPTLEEKIPTALSLGGHQGTSVGILIKDEDTTLSLQIPSSRDVCSINNSNNKKSRVHECSMCGAEFSSGQALGGHMRRHRPLRPMATSTSSNDEGSHGEAVKKPRILLSLDLNLPAVSDQVEDDYSRESEFPFASPKEQVIVFSSSQHPLVDCHY